MPSDKMTLKELMTGVFTKTQTEIKQNVVFGTGIVNDTRFNLIGTAEDTSFGVDEAMEMAKHVLGLLKENNRDPIVLLTNVIGQKLSVRDEWLGMYAYFAHLLKCLHLARKNGNQTISLVYNQAIGGSFIAFGMMADSIFALKNTQLAVMWLEGMAKVTKIDIEILRSVSQTSPVFAPGVENFKKLGGIHEVLELNQVAEQLLKAAKATGIDQDNRAELGKQYGGRTKAYDLIQAIKSL
ncbi:biotin-independent malonate decarboxylase subunit gamma [Legionella micdadei]|uniref:Malonate decarboxylase gamma subunit n=1 Tax=Legionella micdadei TaxID=451 RepID=A0A098GGM7_LEGMI|nr:biotin-independent malonate decarboxylase subunit gamma [Legionella micdadei]ARG97769.1 biotin-independent malonate decarboxylase subunit gamma [Legionella micdadei]ARG99918.1 biotin-independent malonate decarboxylase subunit gamma [Legionella micdadei]KTD28474.1 malonate decarboxylase subunit gamma [Legionella micdadei]NSL18754.1 biotin-independent malonate decarboxylase subunit gamma [Legionella micdadei]CEG60636.1 Malonate decarboxylase gamma subunit [Legionella micdadei]